MNLSPPGICGVCGDKVIKRHYGELVCLACVVFFRRSVLEKRDYQCIGSDNCQVNRGDSDKKTDKVLDSESRIECRSCRLKKCFSMGLKPEVIRKRDIVGPRQLSVTEGSSRIFKFSFELITNLYFLQRQQRTHHCQNPRPACSTDLNLILKLSFQHSNEFCMKFHSYQRLTDKDKSKVLSEFAISYLLIDQGFKTAGEADNGHWLFQNGTFLDSELAADLIRTISNPFRNLEIDQYECVFLKTLLLLKALDNQGSLIRSFLSEFFRYSNHKSLSDGPVRLGQILLLLGEIRCGVKKFYNETREEGIFNWKNIDTIDTHPQRPHYSSATIQTGAILLIFHAIFPLATASPLMSVALPQPRTAIHWSRIIGAASSGQRSSEPHHRAAAIGALVIGAAVIGAAAIGAASSEPHHRASGHRGSDHRSRIIGAPAIGHRPSGTGHRSTGHRAPAIGGGSSWRRPSWHTVEPHPPILEHRPSERASSFRLSRPATVPGENCRRTNRLSFLSPFYTNFLSALPINTCRKVTRNSSENETF